MADINVERKSGPPIWLWILGLVLLGLLIWALASMLGGDDRRATTTVQDTAAVFRDTAPATTTTTGMGAAALPAGAQAFMRDCHLAEGTRTDDMGMQHEFTVNCFEQLAGSIEAVAQQHQGQANVNQHVQTMRERAQQIRQSDPQSTQHANWTREAAEAGASAMESLHQAHHATHPEAQTAVSQVRQAAQQINPQQQHLEQLTDLRSYFRRAGDALQVMAQQPR